MYSDTAYTHISIGLGIVLGLGLMIGLGIGINCIFGYSGPKPLCYFHNCRRTVTQQLLEYQQSE